MEQDTIVMQDIYQYVQEGIDENGRAVGHFEATGIRPTFMDKLESAGVRLPASAFRQRVMMRRLSDPESRLSRTRLQPTSRRAVRSMSPLIISIAVFVGVAALVGGVAHAASRRRARSQVEDRLDMLTGSRRNGRRRRSPSSSRAARSRCDEQDALERFVARFGNLQAALRAGRHAR